MDNTNMKIKLITLKSNIITQIISNTDLLENFLNQQFVLLEVVKTVKYLVALS